MSGSRIRRPSPALIVALVALVAALAGTATALPGKNTVDKNDIKRNAVKSKQVKNNSLTGADIKDDSLGGADINEGSLAAPASVQSLAIIPLTTVNEGSTANLFTRGPLTIVGSCESFGTNDTRAEVLVNTTEADTAGGGQDQSATDDFDPADNPIVLSDADDTDGDSEGTSGDVYDDTVSLFTQSGTAVSGVVSPWANADAGASGQCRFHGHLAISG